MVLVENYAGDGYNSVLFRGDGVIVIAGGVMQNHDMSILEMLGCLYEDLDIDKIEEKFAGLVNSVFSFDRTALFFVKHTGDQVLRWVSDLLRSALRKNDVISRYGGEEFAMVLLNTDKAQATAIAEKLRNAIEESPFRHGTSDVRITLSFGVAALGTDSRTFEGLVAQADKALYRAKANGRNRVCAC